MNLIACGFLFFNAAYHNIQLNTLAALRHCGYFLSQRIKGF